MLPTQLPNPEQSSTQRPIESAPQRGSDAWKQALIPGVVLLVLVEIFFANTDIPSLSNPVAESEPCEHCFARTFRPERYCEDVREALGLEDASVGWSVSSSVSYRRSSDTETASGHFSCPIPGPDFIPSDRLIPAGSVLLDEAEKRLQADGIPVHRLSAGATVRSPGLHFGDGERIEGWLRLENHESWGKQTLRLRIDERRESADGD